MPSAEAGDNADLDQSADAEEHEEVEQKEERDSKIYFLQAKLTNFNRPWVVGLI